MIDSIITFCIGFISGTLAGTMIMALNLIAKTWDQENEEGEGHGQMEGKDDRQEHGRRS